MMSKFKVARYLEGLKNTWDSLDIKKIEKIAALISEAGKRGRRIFIFGNGGSAATAAHFSCDLNKCCRVQGGKRLKVVCLNDNIPAMLAYANDDCYENVFAEQLAKYLEPQDLVIGVSGSGNSENVLRAIRFANKNKALTIGITGFNGGKLKGIARYPLVAGLNDMQQVEDTHLIILHIIMKIIMVANKKR